MPGRVSSSALKSNIIDVFTDISLKNPLYLLLLAKINRNCKAVAKGVICKCNRARENKNFMMCCTRSIFVYNDAGRAGNEDGNLITEQTSS